MNLLQEPAGLSQALEIKPVLAFDMHGVFLHFGKRELIKRILQAPWTLRQLLHFANPLFYYRALVIRRLTNVPEHFIIMLAKDYPAFHDFIPAFINLLNAQVPCDDTIALLDELAQEHRLILFSNIGEQTFSCLQREYPELFKLFDRHVYAQSADNWVQKPQPEAFVKLIACAGTAPEKILFIDDKKKNIEAAERHGIQTVQFTGHRELRKTLQARGFLTEHVF